MLLGELKNLAMSNNQIQILTWFLSVILLASCSDIGITKRLYRPGFHVDIGKGAQSTSNSSKTERDVNEESHTLKPKKVERLSASVEPLERLKVQQVKNAFQRAFEEESRHIKDKPKSITNSPSLVRTARELKHQLKSMQDEKYGKWRTLGLVALCAGITAIILVVLGFALLVAWYSKGYQSNDDRPVLGLLFTGGILGLIGLIAGGLSKKRIKQTGQKGRGFSMTGLITGIVALGLMVLTFLVMAIGGPPRGR